MRLLTSILSASLLVATPVQAGLDSRYQSEDSANTQRIESAQSKCDWYREHAQYQGVQPPGTVDGPQDLRWGTGSYFHLSGSTVTKYRRSNPEFNRGVDCKLTTIQINSPIYGGRMCHRSSETLYKFEGTELIQYTTCSFGWPNDLLTNVRRRIIATTRNTSEN